MADFKKLADEAAAKAALASVKDAARRAIEDLTTTDEERALREAERAKEARVRKWKWIAGAVVGVLAFFAILSILAKLWVWVVGLALLAALAYAIYFYVRPKVTAVKVRVVERLEESRAEEAEQQASEDAERRAAEAAKANARAAEAEKAAAIAREQAIDDELAALKAKTGKR